jgi:hypothetical protein
MGNVVASTSVASELGAIGIGNNIVRVVIEVAEEGEVFNSSFVYG